MGEYGIEIGDAKYSNGGAKNHKLKKGEDNIHRILPPLGTLAAKGIWAVDHRVHWGYKSGDNKFRTFECIEERDRNKMVIKRCPECDKNAKLKSEYERKFKNAVDFLMKEKKMGEDQAKKVATAKLEPFKAVMDQYNRSFRFYMNTVNDKDEIGVLNISYAHFKLLREKIAELRRDQIDPLKPSQGAWFNFKYADNNTHSVDIQMVGNKAEGQKLKPGALTEDVLKRLKNEVADLTELFRQVTGEQVQKLVDSGGSPEVVDSIFSRGEVKGANDGVQSSVDLSSDFEIPDLDAPAAAVPQPAASPASVPAAGTELKAAVADLQAAKTTPPAPATPSPSSNPLAPPDVNIPDDQFDDLFGKM